MPLGTGDADLQPASASAATVFARLAPGATLEAARSELEVAGQRAAADFPEVYEHLTPRVDGFASRASGGALVLVLSGVGALFAFLLVVACANVATLVFARTVTREGEIAVRSALGASRRRIVFQLFAEALVLVGGATLLGLAVARLAIGGVGRLFFVIQQMPAQPFWWNDELSPMTVLCAFVLAMIGAVLVGVVPGLKATSGEVQPRLGQLSTGGGGGLRFGGIWTVVIVLQVALSVAFLPLAVAQAGVAFADHERSGFAAQEYVTAQLGRDPAVPPRTLEEREAFLAESARLFEEAREAIASDPAVEGVALASGLSAMNHIVSSYELVGDGSFASVATRARMLLVDLTYLDLMGATSVAGQSLGPADFTPESRSVVVNEAFVDAWLDGRNAVGGRLRVEAGKPGSESSIVDVLEDGTSLEIVGVVSNPGIDAFGPGTHPVIYAPLDLAPVTPRDVGLVGMPQSPAVQLFVRMRPDAGSIAGRLHTHLNGIDPTLRLSQVATAADTWGPVHLGMRISGWIFMAVAGIVLMLSVAGIYALMSFTVSRRTREIAIRTAVGAGRRQIVGIIFGRAVLQLAVGVVLGSLIAVPVLLNGVSGDGPLPVVIVAGVLLTAGTAACLVPVRRVFAIEPAMAMRAE